MSASGRAEGPSGDSQPSSSGLNPPPYTPVDSGQTRPSMPSIPSEAGLTPEALAALTSAFSSLSLPDAPTDLSPDTCLAHLKLLYAFHQLKEDIGYTNGLWGIHENTLDRQSLLISDGLWSNDTGSQTPPEERIARALSKLREKRWALYVARAADRYEAWWHSLQGDRLTEADMESEDMSKYAGFVHEKPPKAFDPSMLPPLGRFFIEYVSGTQLILLQ